MTGLRSVCAEIALVGNKYKAQSKNTEQHKQAGNHRRFASEDFFFSHNIQVFSFLLSSCCAGIIAAQFVCKVEQVQIL